MYKLLTGDYFCFLSSLFRHHVTKMGECNTIGCIKLCAAKSSLLKLVGINDGTDGWNELFS